MKNYQRCFLLLAVLTGLCAVSLRGLTQSAGAGSNDDSRALAAREDAYRANNLGVALLEQYKYKEGAEAFTRALQLDPQLRLARVNLAIALYNVPDLAAAEHEARSALLVAPDLAQPRYILGLIAKTQNRADDALAAFARVLELDPRDVGSNVNSGQLLTQQRKYTEAIAAFRAAIASEPYNMTALYNLSLVLTRTGQRAEAQQMLARFQQLQRSGAGTSIGTTYPEQGRYAEALASTGAEPELVDKRTPAVVFTDATASAFPRAAAWTVKNSFPEQTHGAAVLFDTDADGDLDLLEVAGTAQRLYRNDNGKFTDVTAQSGALAKEASDYATGAVAGDFDNDGLPDIFILRYRASALYRNEGNGRFADVTAAAKIPLYPYLSQSVAFVDCDHDGDLDIFIAGHSDLAQAAKTMQEKTRQAQRSKQRARAGKPRSSGGPHLIGVAIPSAPNLLLRNNGDGTFTDQTAAAKLDGAARAFAVVPTDFDNRRDVDLFIATDEGSQLWRNLRDGSFRNVAGEVGLGPEQFKASSAVAAGDVNKDGFTDFYFARGEAAGYFALSDGKANFQVRRGPGGTEDRPSERWAKYTSSAQFVDYDNDGLLDIVAAVVASSNVGDVQMELRVWRNTGDGWTEVTERAARGLVGQVEASNGILPGARVLASGDVDNDGDTDLIFGVTGGGLRFARNDGGNLNESLRVQLAGRVSNRSGVGAKVEARSGSLTQKLETYAASPAPAPADLVFGLGPRATVDAVRVLWPAGIVQAETDIPASNATDESVALQQPNARRTPLVLPVKELDRKPSSCPFLYTWNGARFEFITDFMGGGETGYWEGPGGHYNTPDPDEYVRIRGDQLKERDGLYELRVTNELEEALFIDRLQLVAVAHPIGTEVYPNEGMINPPLPPFKLYTTRAARPPLAATDDRGRDMLARISHQDRLYADDFPPDRVRGYTAEHTLTLKLEQEAATVNKRALLLLNGWTDYAFSSDNLAASHAGRSLRTPALQVKDARGRWRTVIENIGIPIGRPQTVTLDLTGKFLTRNREVRIVTNMRIYWDEILVDTSPQASLVQMTRLEPLQAELRWRGYSREVSPDKREPFGYDYERVSPVSPWKTMPGHYTREGDVRPLLLQTDDQFVISRPGDEVSLSFDARALPALPAGWTRTFLLYADGFSKEMDINSASPDQLGPLPFHGMTRYPYRAPEAYPLTPARRAYIEQYNTRFVAAPVPKLVTSDK
jgi:tetratricopeptide (TPR) repeat protein